MDTIRLGARLRAARKAAGFKTSKAFLRKNKVPASTYSQHESGTRIPDDETLKFYSKVFLVNFEWLKLGKGLPYSQATSTSKNNIVEEELLDLNKFKISPHNSTLLSSILEELLLKHASPISHQTAKTVAKAAIKIYGDIISLDASNKTQLSLFKKAIHHYNK